MAPNLTVSAGEESETTSRVARRFCWHVTVLLLLVVLFGLIRWRLAQMPLERDEGEYAYAGQLMLQDIPPYKFAYNMKLPGTYAAYAVIMAIFGETPQGIHLGVLLINTLTLILIYCLAGRLFGRTAGIVAAATYGLLSTHQTTLGFAGHATHFVVLAAVGGLVLLLRAIEQNRLPLLFWSGILFGLAFVMKQPGIFFAVFAFLYLFYIYLRRRPAVEWAHIAKSAGIFLAGCALPFALTCLILWRAGVFSSFWFWTFSYARQYSSLVSLKDGWDLFTFNFLPMFYAAPAVWVIALIGLTAFMWRAPVRRHAALIIGLLVFSFLAVSSGLYFRTHYFIMLLPALSLLAATAVASAASVLEANQLKPWLRAFPLIVFFLGWGWAIGKNANFYFRLTTVEACHAVYMNQPFTEVIPVAEYLQQHTSPTDKLAVLGSEPEIFFYAHRLSASGYIYVYALMEKQPYWQQMQKQMIQEIESNHPAYILYFNQPATWLTTMGSSRLAPYLDWANAYVKNNYAEVGLVELADPESHFTWGDLAKKTVPKTQYQITVYKRKN
jgi:4-amino-4-deoxy-L-arabinose transferase-like glycosyltransferase